MIENFNFTGAGELIDYGSIFDTFIYFFPLIVCLAAVYVALWIISIYGGPICYWRKP